MDKVRENGISATDVVVYVGPRCHFVQYPLRGGEMFNQVAVFESPRARAGEDDWGTPDELDAAYAGMTGNIQRGLPLMWRDRWWRMFDRDPVMTWVYGRIVLLGDAAHPPLQYIAQGAIMAIEDGYVLAEHLAAKRGDAGDDGTGRALAAYQAVRPEHCRRVLETSRAWGALWHLDGAAARAAQRDPPRPRHPRLQLRRLAVQRHRAHPGGGTANVPSNPAGHPSNGCPRRIKVNRKNQEPNIPNEGVCQLQPPAPASRQVAGPPCAFLSC